MNDTSRTTATLLRKVVSPRIQQFSMCMEEQLSVSPASPCTIATNSQSSNEATHTAMERDQILPSITNICDGKSMVLYPCRIEPRQQEFFSILTTPVGAQGYQSSSFPSPLPSNRHGHPSTMTTPSSILRKRRDLVISPTSKTTSKTISTSPKPSSGRRVGGLWSPSIFIYEEDAGKNDNEPRSWKFEAERSKSSLSPFDSLREETLSYIFCYLPLSDLLRAGRVARRWQYEIHHRKRLPRVNEDDDGLASKVGRACSGCHHYSNNHQLWEVVDASSFVEETYDTFLQVGRKRKLQKKLEASGLYSSLHKNNYEKTQSSFESCKNSKRLIGMKKKVTKKKNIHDPEEWARIQTGLALGRVLRSRIELSSSTTPKGGCDPSVQIRSLVIENIKNRLSADRMDDFLPASLLSSPHFRELSLSNFETLNDTHVHVLLLATILSKTSSMNSQSSAKMKQTSKLRNAQTRVNRLSKLKLEFCSLLTNHTLKSIAKTCSQSHLKEISFRGCHRINSISPLSDFLTTKLVIPANCSLKEEKSQEIDRKHISIESLFLPPSPELSNETKSRTENLGDILNGPPQRTIDKQSLPVAFLFEAFPRDGSSIKRNATVSNRLTTSGVLSQKTTRMEHSMVSQDFFQQDEPRTATSSADGKGIKEPISSKLQTRIISSSRENILKSTYGTNESKFVESLCAPHQVPSTSFLSFHGNSPSNTNKVSCNKSSVVRGTHRISSSSNLTSLFDLPGTSPIRIKSSESLLILPPPPSVPMFEKDKDCITLPSLKAVASFKGQSINISKAETQNPNTTGVVSRRYHRHHRSLSKGFFQFPPLLGDKEECAGNDASLEPIVDESIIVGGLDVLDLRGTSIEPEGFVNFLCSLTQLYPSTKLSDVIPDPKSNETIRAPVCWCRVLFKELHLNGILVEGTRTCDIEVDASLRGEVQCEALTTENKRGQFLWNNDYIRALESVLAMDELKMKATTLFHDETSNCISQEISYYTTRKD